MQAWAARKKAQSERGPGLALSEWRVISPEPNIGKRYTTSGDVWVKRVLDDVGQDDFGHPRRFSLISE